MKKKKVKTNKDGLETQTAAIHKKVVQSTQKQMPIKDITNGIIYTNDDRIVKLMEVYPIPFANLKPNTQNVIRQHFENMFKVLPDKFQLKAVSFPANLSKPLEDLEKVQNETKLESKANLAEEYKRGLLNAQNYTVERKFYLAFSNEEQRHTKVEDIERSISSLNNTAQRVKSSLNSCGNGATIMNSSDIAKAFYFLNNRNSKIPFEEHYESIYKKYLDAAENKNDFYIPPTEYISPTKIFFTDKKYLVLNNRYYTWLYIAGEGYPNSVYCGWLDQFISSYEGVDVDIFFNKKDDRKLKEKLRRTIGHVSADAAEIQSGASDSAYNVQTKYQSAQFLLDCVQSGQSIYNVSTVLTVSGNSIEEVNEKTQNLIDDAKKQDIILRDLRYQEEISWLSTLPLNNLDKRIEKKAKRNMPRMIAATMYPFTAFQLMHEGGLYIANAQGNASPVIPNFWNTDVFINPHIFVCGGSGAGKTSTMELFSSHASVMGIPVFIIAPQKQDDYKRLCTALGGQFISFGEGSPYRINIMAIYPTDETTDEKRDTLYGELGKNNMSYLKQREGIVTNFIHSHYTEMSRSELAILGDALTMAYAKYGITEDNESLWADEEHTKYKEMPILKDVQDALESMNNPEAKNLILELKFFTTGIGSYFNGPTNIDVNNNYFVIGLENNSKETKPLSVYLAEDFCQTKIRRDKNKKFFMIDESWDLIENKFTAQKLAEDSKILRGFGASVVCGTQQLGDLLKSEYGEIIIKNSETRIIMKHEEEDVRYLTQYITLTQQEQKEIQGFAKGEALLLANQDRINIAFAPTEYEGLIMFNDEATLARYEQYVKNQEAEKERQARLKELQKISKPIDDLKTIDEGYTVQINTEKAASLLQGKENNNDNL